MSETATTSNIPLKDLINSPKEIPSPEGAAASSMWREKHEPVPPSQNNYLTGKVGSSLLEMAKVTACPCVMSLCTI